MANLLVWIALCLTLVFQAQCLTQNDPQYWLDQGSRALSTSMDLAKANAVVKRAKNVILFLGDGMGLSTITAARFLKRELNQNPEDCLYFETFPNAALIKTYNVDFPVPDSAGTGTAYLTGVKANKGVIGLNARVNYQERNCDTIVQNKVESVFVQAIEQGKSGGVVTTASITDATPAATYAHVSDRDDEATIPIQDERCKDIARQLVENAPGTNLSVILGGGWKNFLPTNQNGIRTDGRNLFEQWQQLRNKSNLAKGEYNLVRNRQELFNVNFETTKYLFGSFAHNNMKYDKQRSNSSDEEEPSLTEMTETAIRLLQNNKNGFLLLVEGAKIDKAHHDNLAYQALHDVLAFEKAINRAVQMVNLTETLIIVTADHSHGFTMNGYARKNVSIFGFSEEKTEDNVPYTSLLYATGPGHQTRRINQTLEQTSQPNYVQHSAVPLDSATHGGEDVAAYAIGAGSNLLRASQEQTYIAHLMSFSSCLGQYANESHCRVISASARPMLSTISILVIFFILLSFITSY